MPKPGQKSSGGKAPPKTVYWPPRLYKQEMEDIQNRSVQTQAGNPTTTTKTQTYPSKSDQQMQIETNTESKSIQAKWVCRNAKRCSCQNCFVD